MECQTDHVSIDGRARIGTVELRVSDLEQSEKFYTDVLGMSALSNDNGLLLGVSDETPLLRLRELKGAKPRPRRSTGLYHFAVLDPSRPALGRSLTQLAEKGYPLHGAADHLVSEALYLDDPDHIGIEIYRDRPKAEWQFDNASVRMANEPVDLESLLKDAGDRPFEGLERGTTMGHVHLHVRDLEEAEKFYCSLLGFDLMLRWPPGALFVSAGGYHHHIGLNTWAGVGAPPPPEDASGLIHFEIVFPNENSRNDVVERLIQAGVATHDREDGIFLTDPSRNGILLTMEH